MAKFRILGLLVRIKDFLYKKLVKINDTPQRIALGFGLGVFAGILPGTGPLAALFLAFIFKVNRASALIGSLLTNTWLSFITFVLAIKAGSAIFNISWLKLQEDWSAFIRHWQWQSALRTSFLEIFLPVITGYLVVSLCLGITAYLITLIIIRKKRGVAQ